MNVLLCLLSEQHMPNLLSVHHFQPDWLVLVESAEMKRRHAAEHLLKALELGGCDYNVRSHVQPLDQEDNLEVVRKALEKAYAKFPANQWVANLTGGTKPMSIAAYDFFKEVRARLVYVNLSAPNRFLGLDGMPAEICTYQPSVKEFLMGYGFASSKKDEDIHEAQERARPWWDCARLISAADPEPNLLHFDGSPEDQRKQWDKARKKGLDLQPDQFGPASPEVCATVQTCFGLEDARGSLRGRLDKYAVEFLTGGWLEVFLWGLFDHHAATLGVWDVRLGVRPGKIGVETDSEFDVAFIYEYGLSVIECKSGAQEHDPGGDILHKVEAVVRQFRALRVRSYLATTSGNVLDNVGKVKPGIRNRADLYGCRVVVRSQIRKLANDPDSPELVRQVFFDVQKQT